MNVHYHPGKENLVANVLSRLSMGSVAHVGEERKKVMNVLKVLIAWEFSL